MKLLSEIHKTSSEVEMGRVTKERLLPREDGAAFLNLSTVDVPLGLRVRHHVSLFNGVLPTSSRTTCFVSTKYTDVLMLNKLHGALFLSLNVTQTIAVKIFQGLMFDSVNFELYLPRL